MRQSGRLVSFGMTLAVLSSCSGGGPTSIQIGLMQGEWLVTGDLTLLTDNCGIDALFDLVGEQERVIAASDGTLTITQSGSTFTIHGDFNLDGTVTSAGSFTTVEVIEESGQSTLRFRVEGTVSGTHMDGVFVFVFEELPGFAPVCTVRIGFVANRISTTPSL